MLADIWNHINSFTVNSLFVCVINHGTDVFLHNLPACICRTVTSSKQRLAKSMHWNKLFLPLVLMIWRNQHIAAPACCAFWTHLWVVGWVHNPSKRNLYQTKCEWWMQLGDQCSCSSALCVLLCCGPVYEGISCPIKLWHSHWSLCAVIHFVTFAGYIQHSDEWNHSCTISMRSIFCHICIRHPYSHSRHAQVAS